MISLAFDFKMAAKSPRVLTSEAEGRITAYEFSRQCKVFMDGLDRLLLCSPFFAVGFLFWEVFCFIQLAICLAIEVLSVGYRM